MAGMWIDLQAANLSGPVSTRLRAQLYHAAGTGANTARQRVPVRSGRLRRSIKAEITGTGARFGSDVSYASYVEKGTSRMRAQPYLEPGKQAALAELNHRTRGPSIRRVKGSRRRAG